MDAKPADGRSPAQEEPAVAEPHAEERIGPLEIERLRKADGRALIVYRRAAPPR